jgi:hypothetical protein
MEFNMSATSLNDTARILWKRGKVMPLYQRIQNRMAQRMVIREVARSNYIDMIQEVEKEFYCERNGKDQLQEDILVKRYRERGNGRGKSSSFE